MSYNPMMDAREAFDEQEEAAMQAEGDAEDAYWAQTEEDFEDDGQPSEYDEWQDFYGGDDWDHGKYDSYDGE